MPYIAQDDRIKFDPVLQEFDDCMLTIVPTEGEMNYLITSIMHRWLSLVGIRYRNINTAVGIMECAKLELYRKIAAPYEDTKKAENGAVSDIDSKS